MNIFDFRRYTGCIAIDTPRQIFSAELFDDDIFLHTSRVIAPLTPASPLPPEMPTMPRLSLLSSLPE
jgi:hypothetical protein